MNRNTARWLAHGTPAADDQARLSNWEAGGDKLAVMMNIVTEFS
jgi:hypothetical protein